MAGKNKNKGKEDENIAKKDEGGNALFLILIGVALFAALSYAITQSSRSGTGGIQNEQATLDAAVSEQCTAMVEHARNSMTLMGRCTAYDISYELPDGSNENPLNPGDTACFIFDSAGGGVPPCGVYLSGDCPAADLLALNVGDVACGTIAYVGVSSGNRLYTTLADQGTASWNDGSTDNYTTIGATGTGMANTDALIAAALNPDGPYAAAEMCRALGPKWYLPGGIELVDLYAVRDVGAFDGTFSGTDYWASYERSQTTGHVVYFSTGGTGQRMKESVLIVRCMRRD